ncbi:hypothetical protein CKM354_000692600 [Cercospora kikuchii]|uniref:Apple domain-containing protein n=1 Tax=Cercospora kikuchii TaxID=84275 RepID=A0A9P3FIB7_9PEZI|nr:uncharacterized protein CKM354_000692600 [Cercospora kikuchii]GIZ43709.1 hypothetical protein CKM354_000692600 [Cercospora kikuchii]
MPGTNRLWALLPLLYAQFCSSWLSIKTQSTTTTVNSAQTTKAYVTSTTGTNTFTAATVTSTGEVKVFTAPARTTTITVEPTTITLDTVVTTTETSTITLTAEPASVTAELVLLTAPTSVVTETVDASTITIDPVTQTADLVTITSTETITSTNVGFERRDAAPQRNPGLHAGLSLLAGIARTRISSACSCFKLPTPTTTFTHTERSVATTYETINVAAETTVTPTFVETPLSSTTPEVTEYETPRVTVTPISTFIPLHTEYSTPTVHITPSSTSTPLSTEFVTPTVTATPTTTFTPSTTVYTTQTVQVKALPAAKCDSGESYTARDGSKFLLDCQTDAYGSKLPGIAKVVVDDLAGCIDLCTREGTKCRAARWELSTKLCELRSEYLERIVGTSGVYFGIRQTSQGDPQASLVNGDFENGLKSWTQTPFATTGNCSANRAWAVEGGRANINYAYCNGHVSDFLTQPLALVAGITWTFSAQVLFEQNGPPGDGYCSVTFDGFDTGLSAHYGYGRYNTSAVTVTGSGAARNNRTGEFRITASCATPSTNGMRISIDNVNFSTLQSDPGFNPTILAPEQVIRNGDFSSGNLAPWTVRQNVNTSISVVENAAVFSYAGGRGALNGAITQAIFAEVGSTYRYTTKVAFNFPNDLRTSCSINVNAGSTIYTSPAQISTNQTVLIDTRGQFFSSNRNSITITAACQLSATAKPIITIDDISLTLNV